MGTGIVENDGEGARVMKFDLQRARINVRASSTEDLLERCTVFREDMEPEALEVIEEELHSRGIDQNTIDAHAGTRTDVLYAGGLALKCSFCHRGAVGERWGWHRLWGLMPIFPRRLRFCRTHEAR
jgi:hypothetical protein